jgi:SNF2 family DNA or RNA helicase
LEELSEENTNPSFDKVKNLEILVKKKLSENSKSKILIFSISDYSFSSIEPVLQKQNVRYAYIKGNSNQINSVVKKYKGDEINVLLVNCINYGSGLNLENTTDIIMFHKMDSQIKGQVIGRAQRPGRTNPLNVHFLLHDNEISV